ncbi:LicD family protein [Streptococcus marmotae]|uniref:LicD family protein n=1 Tax=Streptococcus marmotae TaxID=1825069 RepID=UPI000833AF30|nr:LicD family protein [Streptococcus marmotae]
MKTSKELYSQAFSEYRLGEETLKKLQAELLSVFLDIKKVCDEHQISYMMAGGSLLGTVRHQGFIPWDDDMDLMMLREDYEKFRDIFSQEFSEKYLLAEPFFHEKYFYKMPKVYKKGTTYVEIANAGLKAFDMIFIDIFIIENLPESRLIRKLKGSLYNLAYKLSSVCIDYLYPSPAIEKAAGQHEEVTKYYRLRKRLGWLATHLGGIHFYLKICDKLARQKKNSQVLGLPSGISFEREVFPRDILTQTITGSFCGYEVNIPQQYDVYLSNLYGKNYMMIPPEEKREYHVAYKVEC